MNVRKRGLALLMCICMIFTLLPFSALADATTQDGDIVYGTYGTDGKWKGDNNLNDTATHPLSGENELTLTKTATKIADNTYRIDLKVVMTQTTSTTPPGSAATVLVIDTSSSMKICATCNSQSADLDGNYYHASNCATGNRGYVKAADTRLAAAKKAAISFLDKYKGNTEDASRYVSVVAFNTKANVTKDWLDVSVQANYTAVVNAINGLSADGGTNLDQALSKAKAQFSADTVKDISASAKNVIALTDGCPTYYEDGKEQHVSYGCYDTNNATADEATELKKVAGVYTVCFGAANEKCWTKGSAHAWGWLLGIVETEWHPTDGPKVGDFLKDSIATSASHAYNASNTADLMSAFEAITNTIVNGLNSGTVTDPMGDNVSLVGTAPSGFATNDNGKTYTWELSGAPGVTNGDKTTYTYETSYTVKLDTSGDDEYHPLNGRTTFTAAGKTYDFNVPGVYREAKYTVTYQPGDHGTLDGAGTDGNVVHSNLKNGDPTPDAPKVNPQYGYYHIGWDPVIVDTVNGSATYTARYEKLNNLSYTIKHYWIGDKTQTIREDIVKSDATLGDTITVEVNNAAHIDGYTIMPEQSENSTTITEDSNKVINLYYYKNVTLESNSGTFTYDGKDHSVSGYDVITKADNGEDVKVDAEFRGVSASRTEKDIGSYPVTFKIRDDAVDKEALIGEIDSNSYYIVSDVEEGTLTIEKIKDEVTVKITGNTKTVTYNGKEHSVTGYATDVGDKPITVALKGGKVAEAKGTDVGTYYMQLTAADFVVTSDIYANIKVIVEDGWLKINRRPMPPVNPPIMDEIIVEITGNSDSVVYDGTEHSVKGYTVKISDPRYTEADFTFTGKAEASGVNAGTYEMGLKAEQFKNTNARFTNVKFVIKADGVLTITPKELIITAGSKTEYGPTPVTCDEWTVSGLVAGDKVESVKITGIQSVPGSSPNVPSNAVIKNAKGEDVTKNYAIKYVNGTLTMLEVLNKEDHFNYIIGTPEGLSLPTANVTRAEVATIFFRLMTDDARTKFDSLDNNFSDVAKGKWYNRAISTLANAGIIKGDPAGTYRPGDPITRAEMAAIIARFGDFKEGGKTFNDISGHWAQKYIELAASNGWINGNPDGTFKPNNNITRAETVAMINRVLNRQTESNDDLLPVSQMTNWSDNMDTAKWYYRDMQEATNNHKAERVGNSIYEKWTEKLPDIDWASYQI